MSGFFLGSVKRPYVQLRVKEDSIKSETLIAGQTQGLKVGCWMGGWVGGGMGGWQDGWAVCEVWVDRWAEGEGKGGV